MIDLSQAHCKVSDEIIRPKSFFDDAILSLRAKKTFDDKISDAANIEVSELMRTY